MRSYKRWSHWEGLTYQCVRVLVMAEPVESLYECNGLCPTNTLMWSASRLWTAMSMDDAVSDLELMCAESVTLKLMAACQEYRHRMRDRGRRQFSNKNPWASLLCRNARRMRGYFDDFRPKDRSVVPPSDGPLVVSLDPASNAIPDMRTSRRIPSPPPYPGRLSESMEREAKAERKAEERAAAAAVAASARERASTPPRGLTPSTSRAEEPSRTLPTKLPVVSDKRNSI